MSRSDQYTDRSDVLIETLRMVRAGHSPRTVAEKRDLAVDTVTDHLLALAERGRRFDLREWLDADRLQQMRRAVRDCNWRPGRPLKTIRGRLDDTWEWYQLKACLAQVVAEGGAPRERRRRGRRCSNDEGGAPRERRRRGRRCSNDDTTRQYRRSDTGRWYSRGYLPHCDRRDRPQFVTYRLGDALPADVIRQIRARTDDQRTATSQMQRVLDAGRGACWLERPEFAEVVVENLEHHDGKLYRLLEWVVMPNHVHVAYDRPRTSLRRILHAWKSYTSSQLKPKTDLGEKDHFWQRGFFDRYVRDEDHLSNVENYIYLNPVKAGLVDDPFEWDATSLHKHDDLRPRLRSWWRAQIDEFWRCVEVSSKSTNRRSCA